MSSDGSSTLRCGDARRALLDRSALHQLEVRLDVVPVLLVLNFQYQAEILENAQGQRSNLRFLTSNF